MGYINVSGIPSKGHALQKTHNSGCNKSWDQFWSSPLLLSQCSDLRLQRTWHRYNCSLFTMSVWLCTVLKQALSFCFICLWITNCLSIKFLLAFFLFIPHFLSILFSLCINTSFSFLFYLSFSSFLITAHNAVSQCPPIPSVSHFVLKFGWVIISLGEIHFWDMS